MTNDTPYMPNLPDNPPPESDAGEPMNYVGEVNEPELLTAPPREKVDNLENKIDGSKIEGRDGNFVFTVGKVSSGKSTLQSFLIHRLWTDSRIVFEHAPSDGNEDNDAYLHGWVNNVANGLFPERTGQGNIREFCIRFGHAARKKLTLNFIEIAGEDIVSIVPSVEPSSRQLNPFLERYLREPGINKRFVFVSDASQIGSKARARERRLQEDILFTALINHLRNPDGIALKRISILFVVSKWDQVKNDYRSVKHYFREHFPQTLALTTRSAQISANFMPFSVGEVSVARSEEQNKNVPLIVRKDTRYIDFFISWLYGEFVRDRLPGYPQLSPTPLQRFKNWVARLL
ncbi:MAG: hypothetical protein AB8G17_14580 [Gammaproteobacteria bacterium]